MSAREPVSFLRNRGGASFAKLQFYYAMSRPDAVLKVMVIIAAAIALTAFWLVPPLLVLPTMSLMAVAVAGGLALLAWLHRAQQQDSTFTWWDAAGMFAFIGFAAAMLSEPHHVMQILGGEARPDTSR